jgi:hypothetical protein
MNFLDLINTGGPWIASFGCVAACVYMVVKIVPEERKAAGIEREAARKDYLEQLTRSQDKFLTALTHMSDQDHNARHEVANKLGALTMAMYSRLGVPME